jgi:hypothetical protein
MDIKQYFAEQDAKPMPWEEEPTLEELMVAAAIIAWALEHHEEDVRAFFRSADGYNHKGDYTPAEAEEDIERGHSIVSKLFWITEGD